MTVEWGYGPPIDPIAGKVAREWGEAVYVSPVEFGFAFTDRCILSYYAFRLSATLGLAKLREAFAFTEA